MLGFSLPEQALSAIFPAHLKQVFSSGFLNVARKIPSRFADQEILRGHEASRR
jgi:hypothetical protein